MILSLSLLCLLQADNFVSEGFLTLDTRIWSQHLQYNQKIKTTITTFAIHDSDLGKEQFLLLIDRLNREGSTDSFLLKEFTLGNRPKSMIYFHGLWRYRIRHGDTLSMNCHFAIEREDNRWTLLEIYCSQGP